MAELKRGSCEKFRDAILGAGCRGALPLPQHERRCGIEVRL